MRGVDLTQRVARRGDLYARLHRPPAASKHFSSKFRELVRGCEISSLFSENAIRTQITRQSQSSRLFASCGPLAFRLASAAANWPYPGWLQFCFCRPSAAAFSLFIFSCSERLNGGHSSRPGEGLAGFPEIATLDEFRDVCEPALSLHWTDFTMWSNLGLYRSELGLMRRQKGSRWNVCSVNVFSNVVLFRRNRIHLNL